ncbi:4Fe-4S dicluster domain-containing protein [Ammonifex thiophilus]|uniref:Heterodisulfide reductase subunit C n=1 Tax=Ammonifex thiophilus TaxID=444093 RepID=A0A3D8P6W8_9THEO|nr:4Fe-4S dicluster domain-containing protein [Ammonifex thiophilus]RDV83978.1 heterodisulfide reductase subunit C [Ammonifex thiophilus]
MNENFWSEVNRAAGQKITHCYQCGKCTAGCPVAFAMDYKPHQILRLLQLGRGEELLSSRALWVCSSCQTCTTRCPCHIDLARLIDTLRFFSRQAFPQVTRHGMPLFNEVFLRSVKRYGRVYELGLTLQFNLKERKVWRDLDLGHFMLSRRKLRLLPEPVENRKEVAQIFSAEKEEPR